MRDRRRLGSRLDSRLCTDAFKEYYEYSDVRENKKQHNPQTSFRPKRYGLSPFSRFSRSLFLPDKALTHEKKSSSLCSFVVHTASQKKKHTNTNVCHAPTTSLFLPGFHVGDDHHPQAEEITSDEDDLERRGRPRRRHGYVLFSSIPFFFYRDVVIHLSG